MKVALVLFSFSCLLVLIACQDPVVDKEVDGAFENFKKKYEKSYSGSEEERARKLQYIKCYILIKRHNQDFERGKVTYRLKENSFCDAFDTEKTPLTNGNIQLPSESEEQLLVRGKTIPVIAAFVRNALIPTGPSSFNWLDVAPQCTTPVKDQGFYCNSCWAFSGLASLEYQWCMKKNETVILSEQQLISCNVNGTYGNLGCSGGSQSAAYMYIMQNFGIQNTSTYPYLEHIPHNGTHPCTSQSSLNVASTNGFWRIRPGNETLLRDVIAFAGPVSAALYGSLESFAYYWDGIYDDPTCPIGTTHSVLIVGYGTENGVDYWLCKNSWSSDWGTDGYFKIRRGVNRCGITVYLIYPALL